MLIESSDFNHIYREYRGKYKANKIAGMVYVPNSHNPKLLFFTGNQRAFHEHYCLLGEFSCEIRNSSHCVSMEHRYVTNHHAITFRWEFQLLLIFQDDYVSCRSIDIHYSITIGDIGAPSCPSQGVDSRKQDDGSRHERSACDVIHRSEVRQINTEQI